MIFMTVLEILLKTFLMSADGTGSRQQLEDLLVATILQTSEFEMLENVLIVACCSQGCLQRSPGGLGKKIRGRGRVQQSIDGR